MKKLIIAILLILSLLCYIRQNEPVTDFYIEPTPVMVIADKPQQAKEIKPKYTLEDKTYMAKVVFAESRGECNEGQRAIVKVILNRLESPIFPDSIPEVIQANGQFVIGGTYTEKEMQNVEYVIENDFDMPDDVCYFGTWAFGGIENVWGKIGNHYFMR